MTTARGIAARIEGAAIAGARALLGLGLIAMVLLNVANAAGRYGGYWSLTGADEALVYGMIWIVMLGAILATRQRDHLVIDLLPATLGPAGAAALRLVTDAASMGVCAFVARHSWTFVDRIGSIGATSMGLGVPMVIPHAAILVGFAGMALVSALLVLSDVLRLARPAPFPKEGRA